LTTSEAFTSFDPLADFYGHVSKQFLLKANGQSLTAELYGFTTTAGNKSGFTLMLDAASSAAMRSNLDYQIVYANPDQGDYHWVFPANFTVTKP
jgi:hypothetical protein